jgi:hypothetical protein
MISSKQMEHHKWLWYLVVALVLTIFGLAVYQVVMQERKVDRYYMSLVFTASNQDIATAGVPAFPATASGTLNAGIQQVRNATVDAVSTDPALNANIPHWSAWKLNIVPVIDSAAGSVDTFRYHYTFPINADVLDDTRTVLQNVLVDAQDRDSFFAGDATRLAWAQSVFDNDISMSLTYGTYGTGSAAGATK